jgi:hypothetical protein
MPIVPIPNYAPDVSDYEGQSTKTALNVRPRADGYGPFPDFSVYSSALPATCRGFFYARKNDGSVQIFAGTSDRLWTMSNTDFTWVPCSKVTALTSISNASPAVFTLNSHGRAVGDAIVLTTDGTLPTGLTAGTVYYIISAGFGANSFQVSATAGGSAINTSSAGSGTHSFTDDYTALPTGDQWQFAQFNNFVFAVQTGIAPQVYTLSSSTAFSDLGGSPPQARYVAVVGRFLVLSGLTTSAPYRIHWSGLNATTTWTSGTTQSDYQDFPDGGIVRSVAGGEYGLIFQDGAVRRMTYAPGSPVIFQIDRITEERGIYAPLSIVRAGSRVFYCGSDGFQMITPGGYPVAIGKERVDRTFFADVDSGHLQLIIGAPDPNATRVYWAYKSVSGNDDLFDKILCYDWTLDKWSLIEMSGEYLATLARPGVTLDALDSISSSIDALTFSLDDVSTGAAASLSAFNSDHKLGFFSGSNLEATLVTAEKGGDGRRLRVRGFRPVTDAGTVYGSLSTRETASATATDSTEVAMNSSGNVPANVSTRYTRMKLRIPAGTTWTYATGAEPSVTNEGRR